MRKTTIQLQAQLLEQQIELEESNYKYAIQLGRDYTTQAYKRSYPSIERKIIYDKRKPKKEMK